MSRLNTLSEISTDDCHCYQVKNVLAIIYQDQSVSTQIEERVSVKLTDY